MHGWRFCPVGACAGFLRAERHAAIRRNRVINGCLPRRDMSRFSERDKDTVSRGDRARQGVGHFCLNLSQPAAGASRQARNCPLRFGRASKKQPTGELSTRSDRGALSLLPPNTRFARPGVAGDFLVRASLGHSENGIEHFFRHADDQGPSEIGLWRAPCLTAAPADRSSRAAIRRRAPTRRRLPTAITRPICGSRPDRFSSVSSHATRRGRSSAACRLPRSHSRCACRHRPPSQAGGCRWRRECPASGGIRRPLPVAGLGWRPAQRGGRIPSRARRCRPRSAPAAAGLHLGETIASAAISSCAD